jgi:hypothetical protein
VMGSISICFRVSFFGMASGFPNQKTLRDIFK